MKPDTTLDKYYYIIGLVCIWLAFETYRIFMAMEDSTAASPSNDIATKDIQKKSYRKKCSGNNNNNNSNGSTNNTKRKDPPPKVNLSRKQAGSNWENSTVAANAGTSTNTDEQKTSRKKVKHHTNNITKYVAIDCEMVGIGEDGQDDMLARVSIVNQNGTVLLDKYVKPREIVTDYRTKVSGIRPKDIENGEDFNKVQDEVIRILHDKILVGHSLNNDLAVLFIKHPYRYIRDTAKYKPLAKLVANGATPSLKRLTKVILGLDIQSGEHNSVEDARAAMSIYNRFSTDWEGYLKRKNHYRQRQVRANKGRS